MEPRSIPIRGDVILLQSLLKLTGAIVNGGEVKTFLHEESVFVNGEREERRGRKLHDGDVVTLPDGERIQIAKETA